MAFPVVTPTKVYLDQSTDSPAMARSELATLVDLVTQMIQSYGQIDGLCDLDSSGAIPTARFPSGAIDADSANRLSTARTFDITGDITADGVTFDGTADVTIVASVNNDSHTHTAATYGAVGSYVIAATTEMSEDVMKPAGNTVSGGSLRYHYNAIGKTSLNGYEGNYVMDSSAHGLGLAGVWMLMTNAYSSVPTNYPLNLFLRIS